jgi:bifunctional non-homologous end joining protein LigD
MADKSPERILVKVGGRQLEVSNLDKVLYPAYGFTKGEVINYYTQLAPIILPHLHERALTRIRYPNGVDSQGFFEKNIPAGMPRWIRHARLPSPGSTQGRETIDYVVVDEMPTLVWLANMAALELHVPQWRVDRPAEPDLLVIDLDPGPPAGLHECAQAALLLQERLGQDGLTAYPKTSGKKGMQLMCAISGEQTADAVSAYAKRIAEELERKHSKLIVSRMAKNLRPRKVFLDWSQNNAAKTTVAPYSLRAERAPTVSTPMTWDEVREFAGDPVATRQWTAGEVLARVVEHGDLLEGLLEWGPQLPTR